MEKTPDGYFLIGSGFGTDRAKVQVFEGNAPIGDGAVLSLANDRSVVRSKATGVIRHKVVVAGQASPVVSFSHPSGLAASPSQSTPIRGVAAAGATPQAPRSARVTAAALPTSRTITTGEITMTGVRPRPGPVAVGTAATHGPAVEAPRGARASAAALTASPAFTTGEITMTGVRPPHGSSPAAAGRAAVRAGAFTAPASQTITTGEITMTGVRGNLPPAEINQGE